MSFSKLKDPKLQLTDKLTFGKFKDCRLCDIIEDHHEYLIWAEKQGFMKYSQEVTDVILEQAHFERWAPPLTAEETVKEVYYNPVFGFSDMEDDVPY